MKEFTVYFCQKDPYSGSVVTKKNKTMKGKFIPRIGELLLYKGSHWEVIEVSHEYDENTECIKTFINVI